MILKVPDGTACAISFSWSGGKVSERTEYAGGTYFPAGSTTFQEGILYISFHCPCVYAILIAFFADDSARFNLKFSDRTTSTVSSSWSGGKASRGTG
jgi:hypothetical protein